MLTRSLAAVLALLFSAAAAFAGDAVPYDKAVFAEAQKAGKPILVDVHAPWCSTCKAQKAALAQILKKPDFKDVVVFDVDFDTQKDVWSAMGAQSRSTLIVFKGEKETGRSVGDTKAESIEALIRGAL